jgi:unspecific monooxygenase
MNLRAPMQALVDIAPRVGPLFETTTLGARYVHAVGADVVAELNDEKRFAKHLGPELTGLIPAAGDGLFTAENDSPNWHAAHQLLVPAFSQQAMRTYHPVMLDVATELTTKWDGMLGQAVDVPADMTRVALETISRSAAGYSFGSFDGTRQHPFVRHMISVLKGGAIESFLRRSWLPTWMADVGEWRVRRHGNKMALIVDEIVDNRRRSPDDTEDLLALMLRPGPDGNPILDEANIRYQLITFLVAGHETTSGALSFALHHLSMRPDLVARAREEIDRVWGDTSSPSFEQVTKLRYFRRIFDETLRLHPTVPGYFRKARHDTTLSTGHPVQADDWFLVLVGGLHRDPLWGPDPDEFDPDRFLPELVRERPGHLYKPFGTGLRSCIGRQFAIHEAVLILATLIRRYDLTATPGYRLRTSERLTAIPRGLRLTPTLASSAPPRGSE